VQVASGERELLARLFHAGTPVGDILPIGLASLELLLG
jgi:hypothetical protein